MQVCENRACDVQQRHSGNLSTGQSSQHLTKFKQHEKEKLFQKIDSYSYSIDMRQSSQHLTKFKQHEKEKLFQKIDSYSYSIDMKTDQF